MFPLFALQASALAVSPPSARVLVSAWREYERAFVQADGRVIDHKAGGITTSEGQAYGLVRAVWANDRPTADRLLRWTRDNLQGGDPAALPAWKWGQKPDGGWGVIDAQPAADADIWLAYGLLLAHGRWPDGGYKKPVPALLAALWEQEVERLGDRYVLLPGPWARQTTPRKINPSYLLPFAFRSFAKVDKAHPWLALVDDSYLLLAEVMAGGALPADWVFVDPATGRRVAAPTGEEAAGVFGFESMRVPWTLAAEVAWADETRARALLVPFAALGSRWRETHLIPGVMTPAGVGTVPWGYPGLYGTLLPAWAFSRPEDAGALYERNIAPTRCAAGWGDPLDYYAQNWTWLGLALWAGLAHPPEKL